MKKLLASFYSFAYDTTTVEFGIWHIMQSPDKISNFSKFVISILLLRCSIKCTNECILFLIAFIYFTRYTACKYICDPPLLPMSKRIERKSSKYSSKPLSSMSFLKHRARAPNVLWQTRKFEYVTLRT